MHVDTIFIVCLTWALFSMGVRFEHDFSDATEVATQVWRATTTTTCPINVMVASLEQFASRFVPFYCLEFHI